MRTTFQSALLMILCSIGSGAVSAQDHCNALLSHGIRNEWASISEAEWNNLVFHKHCRKNGNDWTFSHKGQVGLEVGQIPLGIAGDWFASEEKKVQFCKEQADISQGHEMDAFRLGLLSSEALQAWNQCQRLANEGVKIRIGDLDAQMLSFSVWRSGDDPVVLHKISFLGIEFCEVNGEPVKVGTPLNRSVDNGQTNVRCWRKIETDEPGVVRFAPAEIGIDTNRGQLDINLPVWRSLPLASVAEVMSDLDVVKRTTAAMSEAGRFACSETEAKDLCRCKRDPEGDVKIRVIVCLSVCPDGRVRDFRIEEAHGGGIGACPDKLPSPVRTMDGAK